MLKSRSCGAAVLAAALFFPVYSSASDFDSNTFGALRARSIGPAVMGGRIAAMAVVPGDPLTIYVGAASGGVWKSTDGGTTFDPIFDDHGQKLGTQSIGALAVDSEDPKVLWVGTGEPWTRNTVSVGDGVYRTTDGGDTWKHLGLRDSERISRILLHPEESDTAWVCATGQLWSANEERGVFKTTDAGETWEHVLSVDEDTGCAELAMDPQDPGILYAGMWQFRRQPWTFNSGGPGSGLYKSTDGGETWRRLEKGLPEGDLGRIAVAVAPSRPSRLYATVEAEESGLYRSDDLGESWERVNTSPAVTQRPFYFSLLVVDPEDYDRVYKPGFTLFMSEDAGETFTSRGGPTHPDHHALWIDPHNPQRLLLGTDGGLYSSNDRGLHWAFHNSIPISQFYHVSHDLELPYNVYGGLQDNGSWTGPSQSPGGVRNRNWSPIGFGDGFWAFPDPRDSNTVYVEFQGGRLLRVDQRTGEIHWIQPFAEDGQEELRFNWNTPIHLSPNHEGTVYYGSQYLHRSRDRGLSWETLSPDLTTDDPEKQRQKESGGLTIDNSTAENHCSIYTIGESPKDDKVIWVGTDDGNLQLTRDGGESWNNVVDRVPDLPPNTWVSSVHPSSHEAGTVFVTFDGHRHGDMATYVYRSQDYGESWQRLSSGEGEAGGKGKGVWGYAHMIKQDPVAPQLLYLGTEHGLFISLDGGEGWAQFRENLPAVSVRDLVVHPDTHDLILATHGRGVYIIDDISPLRGIDQQVLEQKLVMLPSRPSEMTLGGFLQWFPADDEFVGDNPSGMATLVFFQKKRHLFGDFKVEIYDQDGELLTTLPGGKRPGLNRIGWPMRLKPPRLPRANALVPAFAGPRVPEGVYTVKLLKGKDTVEGKLELVADPRSPHPPEDRALQQKTALELYRHLEDLAYLAASVSDLEKQVEQGLEATGGKGKSGKKLRALQEALGKVGENLASKSSNPVEGDERLREKMGMLYGAMILYDGRPTESQLSRMGTLVGQLEEAQQSLQQELDSALPALNRDLKRAGHDALERLSREAWEEDSERAGDTVSLSKQLRRELPQRLHAAVSFSGLF